MHCIWNMFTAYITFDGSSLSFAKTIKTINYSLVKSKITLVCKSKHQNYSYKNKSHTTYLEFQFLIFLHCFAPILLELHFKELWAMQEK